MQADLRDHHWYWGAPSSQDIWYDSLGENVLVNHFQGGDICTTKDGLNAIIRNMQMQAGSDPDATLLCPR